MKKLTKAALLAAATAFMLAGVTACGHDDTPPLVVGSTGGSGNGGTEQGGGSGGTEQGGGSGGTEQGGGSGGTEQGEPISFDCEDLNTKIGSFLATLDKAASMDAGIFDGVTLTGEGLKRSNSDTFSVELGKKGANTATFTVESGAKISFAVASTGASNTSDYQITGAGINETGTVTGSSFETVSVTATSAGTVIFSSDGGTNTSRGIRLQKITVTY